MIDRFGVRGVVSIVLLLLGAVVVWLSCVEHWATLFLFAFLGLSGISLNLFSATIFSITIGVGIDYAIHYTSIFNKYKSDGLSIV